jgi:hypothetical protein
MKIPCSNCNQRLEIPEELAGQTIECPACNATLAVPALETPPPAVPQVQESAPQAASSKKSKSSIPKWAIASFAGIAVVVVGLIMFFPDKAVKTDEESQRPSPPAESKRIEPVAEAAKPEPPTAKAPDIDIYEAAMLGNIEAVKQHIAAGTDVNAKDKDNYRTALDWAIVGISYHKQAEAADLLRKHGGKTWEELPETTTAKAPDISIHVSAGTGNIEAVKQYLAAGTDVNAKDKNGQTPLHRSAMGLSAIGPAQGSRRTKRKEVAELLLAKGADVNARDALGRTPLDYYIYRWSRNELNDLLRKHGAKTGEELKAEGK